MVGRNAAEQKFPYPYDKVYAALVLAVGQAGFKMKSQDPTLGRVTASTKISMTSWGENLTFVCEKIDDGNTRVAIESALKMGFNAFSGHKHAANFEKIITLMSSHLQFAS